MLDMREVRSSFFSPPARPLSFRPAGARFSKVPLTLRVRIQILKSKYKE